MAVVMKNREGKMKKIGDVFIDIRNQFQVCPICGKGKLKSIKVYKALGIRMERPEFECGCRKDSMLKKRAEAKEFRIKNILMQSRIDKKFLLNDYKITRNEFLPYYNSLSWIRRGENIIVYGMPGNHKTGNVTVVMKKAAHELISILYLRSSDIPRIFIDKIYGMDIIKKCYSVRLLCLDNFGKNAIEKTGDIMFNLVDYRINNGLSTIPITNGSIDDVAGIFSSPMMSRLRGNDFIKVGPIGIEGEDLR